MLKKLVFACALALVPASALAQEVVATGIGPRVGFSTGPEQLVFGGHIVIGEVAPDITFDPSLEVGIGDDRTIITVNLDMHYHFRTDTRWRPSVGAGASINQINYDEDRFGNRDSDTEVDGGVILGAGVPTRSGNRFFTELKLGLGDVHDLKFMVGWNFKI